jgi:hypothetical protein
MRFFSISSAFIIIYWNHVKSEMADSYFTLSSSVVVKTDNKVKPIVSNRLYRFNNKKTWNDVFGEVTDPEEVDLKKTDHHKTTHLFLVKKNIPRYYIYHKVRNRSFVKNLGHHDFHVFSTWRTWRNGLHHLKLR